MKGATTKVVCCDFDGTICEMAFPDCGPLVADPINMRLALEAIKAEGYFILTHTVRANPEYQIYGISDVFREMPQW